MKILIKSGRVVDPSQNLDDVLDIFIVDGIIKKIGKQISIKNVDKLINAKNKTIIPGLIDIHTHLREPGHEEEETIYTGTKAALKGGITKVCCMPNTHPVIDNQTAVEFLLLKAKNEGMIKVYPVGAISKGLLGIELTEIGDLKKAGVVAISDDGNPVMNALIMRRALEYAKMFDLPVISHCEDKNLSKDGVMNEGTISTLLGLRGIPKAAEEVMVARDIILSKLTGGRLHIAHVSTKGAVQLIRESKANRINVTAEVTPHHLILTEAAVKTYDPNTKIMPPLRTEEDVEALKEGLKDGTIDVIASDHAPHTEEEKNQVFDLAPFGIIGLETLLPLVITKIVKEGILSLSEVIKKLTINPAKILNLEFSGIKTNSPAEIVILDINKKQKITSFVSKSKNSPFIGWELYGIPETVIYNGKIYNFD